VDGGHVAGKRLGANDKASGVSSFVHYEIYSAFPNVCAAFQGISLEASDFFRLPAGHADALMDLSEGE
jgi:hypothetical protein